MKDIKKELLEALEKELKGNEGIGEMSMFSAKELNAPMDILRAEIPEYGPELVSVLGEFFFFPADDKDTLFFTTVITLSSTLPKEAAPDVASAIARLNYYIPLGSYALGDEDKNLVYKMTLPLRAEEKKESQIKDMVNSVFYALGIAEKFLGYIIMVIKNEITVEEMTDMFSGEDGE